MYERELKHSDMPIQAIDSSTNVAFRQFCKIAYKNYMLVNMNANFAH